MEKIYEFSIPGETLTVYDDCVSFKPKGALGFLAKGVQGERKIYYKQIASIQFKNASSLLSGFIEFYLDGHHGSKQGGGMISGTQNENRFYFYKKHQDDMLKAYEFIQGKVKDAHNIVVEKIGNDISSADELRKFKQLLDEGIITEEEFNAKKKEILNL